jgi:DNA-binding transcriptional MerR regulator
MPSNTQGIHAQRFSAMSGVTVRALHHYDRIGLLKPRRSESGYRVYRASDIERLEQIVALKFLGLPLKQIKTLLDRQPLKLPEALRMQRQVLEEKKRLLETAIEAIRKAEEGLAAGEPSDAAALKKIIEVIEMQNSSDWTTKYYNAQARAKIADRAKLWNSELQAQAEKDWLELYRDVEAALDEDPSSERAQALADRWGRLIEGFTGGDPQISEGLKKLHADRENWPQDMRDRMKPFSNPAVGEFIQRALAARK